MYVLLELCMTCCVYQFYGGLSVHLTAHPCPAPPHLFPPYLQGLHKGTSQQALTGGLDDATLVWNMPFDLAWKSTNVFGWPRLVVSVRDGSIELHLAHSCLHLAHHLHCAIPQVYGYDMLGRNIVAGYSSMLVPTTPGRHTRTLRAFAPVSSSMLQSFIAWLTANRPEFWQPTFVAQGKGREVTRVQPAGTITVQINVQSRGMIDHGYDCGAGRPTVPRALAGAARRAQPAAPTEPAAPGAVPAGGSGTGPNSSRSSRIGSAAVEARARARAARARAAVEARAEEREASNARSTSSSRRAAASSNDDKLPPITAPGITPAARREQPTIEAVSDAEPDTPAGTLRRGGSTRRGGATQAPRDAGRTAAADSAARGLDEDGEDDDLAGAATRRSSSRWRQVSAVTRAVSGSRRTRAAGEQEW